MIFIYLPLRREDWSKIPSSGLTLSTMEQVAGHTKFLECIEEILHMPSLVVRILGIQCCSLCLALTTLNLALAALICLRSGSAAVLDGPVLHLSSLSSMAFFMRLAMHQKTSITPCSECKACSKAPFMWLDCSEAAGCHVVLCLDSFICDLQDSLESLVRFYDAEEDQTHGFIIVLHHHCIIVSLCCCHVCVCVSFDAV